MLVLLNNTLAYSANATDLEEESQNLINETNQFIDLNSSDLFEISGKITDRFNSLIQNPKEIFSVETSPEDTTFKLSKIVVRFEKGEEYELNLAMMPKEMYNTFHHEWTVLSHLSQKLFGFNIYKPYNSKDVIISFPTNNLFNKFLKILPVYCCDGIAQTYFAIGEVSAQVHVENWIDSYSWPYDGGADSSTRLKDALHDAHHIILSKSRGTALSNIVRIIRKELKEKDRKQLLSKDILSNVSSILEMLHNYAADLVSKRFHWIDDFNLKVDSEIVGIFKPGITVMVVNNPHATKQMNYFRVMDYRLSFGEEAFVKNKQYFDEL